MSAPPPTARPARRRAFTIAEVMVAAGVMALALTTAVTTMQQAFLALDSARNITLAGQIMQSQVERLRMKSWTEIEAYQREPQPKTLRDDDFDEVLRRDHPEFLQRFTLKRAIADLGSDLKEITLTMSWRGYDGRPASRFYKTYYGRNGLYDYYFNSY
jgi:Tfp pilus assembly protein PilV